MSIKQPNTVPYLTTTSNGPLHHIESLLLQFQSRIEAWLRNMWIKYHIPFYTQVDLRNSGFKLAPVDTNLFPARFNNLNRAFSPLCIHVIQTAIEHLFPKAAQILIIPENHTCNKFCLESLATLHEIITKAGFLVRIGSLDPELKSKIVITLSSGNEITIEPLIRDGDTIGVEGFTPCVALLNSDLSSGRAEILQGVKQPITPTLALGWNNHLKSVHFSHYTKNALEFSKLIDPSRGIMAIHCIDEILELNLKQRKRSQSTTATTSLDLRYF